MLEGENNFYKNVINILKGDMFECGICMNEEAKREIIVLPVRY